MKKLEEKRAELNKATGMGDALLTSCHPDSITTIKHWITIIQARFEEVSGSDVIGGSCVWWGRGMGNLSSQGLLWKARPSRESVT